MLILKRVNAIALGRTEHRSTQTQHPLGQQPQIRVKKMKLINDDDLAMGFAILALCYMLWLATDFILQYGGGWIG